MILSLLLLGVVVAACASLLFSTLTYALRDFSRARLTEQLESRGKSQHLQPTLDHVDQLILATAVGRLFANTLVLIGLVAIFQRTSYPIVLQYLLSVLISGFMLLFCSVAIPHALAIHSGEQAIASFIKMIHSLRAVLLPLTRLMQLMETVIRRAARGDTQQPESEQLEEEIEQEILSAVEEGEKEGVVLEDEREMIESVIEFHDEQVGQIMTARTEIYALDVHSTLEGVKAKIAESGHSRIPVFENDLDHVVGVLYARDLIPLLGKPIQHFNIRQYMRPPLFVPETKPLRDLLQDFKLQKIHIAIVLDEYGGTAGLVTIEDIFEELVGDISDEHEGIEPPMLVRLDEHSSEVDARLYIAELNRMLGLNIPEDAGFETLGGFISTTLGRIPASGESFEHGAAKYTILDAEPQRVNRVRIELLPQTVAPEQSTDSTATAS